MKLENKINNFDDILVFLDIKKSSIVALNTKTKETSIIASGFYGTLDGVQIDKEKNLIYFTSMGICLSRKDSNQKKDVLGSFYQKDGIIGVIDLNNGSYKELIGKGQITTPKQLFLDKKNNFLYWSDREGGKVFRSKTDGSELTVLISNSNDVTYDKTLHCVGITIDYINNKLLWTQKGPPKGGKGKIFRANIDIPINQNPSNRTDIEVLLDNLPEPIDLEIDVRENILYWTDRGAKPKGNSLNSAKITSKGLENYKVICTGFKETIGLAIDYKNDCIYVSDLGGNINKVDPKTGKYELILKQGSITGLAI